MVVNNNGNIPNIENLNTAKDNNLATENIERFEENNEKQISNINGKQKSEEKVLENYFGKQEINLYIKNNNENQLKNDYSLQNMPNDNKPENNIIILKNNENK